MKYQRLWMGSGSSVIAQEYAEEMPYFTTIVERRNYYMIS